MSEPTNRETGEPTPAQDAESLTTLYERTDLSPDEFTERAIARIRSNSERARVSREEAERRRQIQEANSDFDVSRAGESEAELEAAQQHDNPLREAQAADEEHRQMNERIRLASLEHQLDFDHSLTVTGPYCLNAGTLRRVESTYLPDGDIFMMKIPDGYSDKDAPFLRPGMCVVQNHKHKHAWVFDDASTFLDVLSNTVGPAKQISKLSEYIIDHGKLPLVRNPTPIADASPDPSAGTTTGTQNEAQAAADDATQQSPASTLSAKPTNMPPTRPTVPPVGDRPQLRDPSRAKPAADAQNGASPASSAMPGSMRAPLTPEAPRKLGPDKPKTPEQASEQDRQMRERMLQGGGGGGGFSLPNLGITRALARMGAAAVAAPGLLASRAEERRTRPEFMLKHMTRVAEDADRRLADFKTQAASAGVNVVFERKGPTARDAASIVKFATQGDGAITLGGFTTQYEKLQRMYAEFSRAHPNALSDPRFINSDSFREFETSLKNLQKNAKGVHAPNDENKVAAVDGPLKRMLEMIAERISQLLSAVGLRPGSGHRATAR